MADNNMSIDDIINMLDEKTSEGVGRIKVQVSDTQEAGTFKEKKQLGRCDINGEDCS